MGNSASGSAARSAPLVEAASPVLVQVLPVPETRDALSVLRPLDEMRRSGALTDCVLSVGDRHFRVHAVVVAGASRHLHASLTGGMRESAGELDADGRRVYRLELDGGMGVLSANALERLIQFMYTHELEVGNGVSNEELLGGAELLELPLARGLIASKLVAQLSLDTWLEVLTLGYKYGVPELKSAGIAWGESHLSLEFLSAAHWRALPLACVQDLLACENMQCIGSEDDVLHAALLWAFGEGKDAEHVQSGDDLATLLTRVRLPHVSRLKLDELRAHPLVRANLACMSVLVDLSSYAGNSYEGAEDGDIGQFWVRRKCFRTVASSLFVSDRKKAFVFSAESLGFKPMTKSPIDLTFSRCASVGGKVYCIEGDRGADGKRRTVCLIPGAANGKGEWINVAPMPYGPPISAAATLNGYIYVAGGSRMDRYSPESDTWEPVASMINLIEYLVPIGGYLYAVEGANGGQERMMERYDPVTNAWEAVTSTSHLANTVGAATMGGLLYVAGGWDASGPLDECFCFNPLTVSWRKIANLPEPRWSVALSCLRGELYAIGGLGPDDDQGASRCPIWRYKPVQDVWEDAHPAEGSATLFIDDNCSWCAM